ncbi:aminotransferase class I/II-fold pyridoxal phosphate-dependent enzyme [Fulvivirga sp. RKSG066]|uniref:methionine aminotransferase n=1 Tax=Fulvivirga aurantia TaxID=2529383 RepID=UPI0012BC65E4|nr:methionine aminotransferase [Fulvivirga aurantia]MTI21393.1 aminotransferase class I/II-fold pyridoxal phosphate-dependent enzyme [Fulvivirga aurantia]
MLSIESKLPTSSTSIFAVMSKMAADHGAINLSQGFPDFPVSSELIGLVNRNMQNGHNQYAPMPGLPSLRKTIAKVIDDSYNYEVDFESDITVTSGATEALFASISAIVKPGDEVIIFDPAYDSYAPAVRLAGGKPVHIALQAPSYAIDWTKVERIISKKTTLIIINTPHNPTGATLSEKDMLSLQKVVLENELFLISDEVYERITFDNVKHESVLRYPELAARSVAIFSFGKTFHATGWKVGYAVAPANLTAEIRKIHQYLTFSVNTPVQHALAEYMTEETNYLNLGSFYQKKRDFFVNRLKDSRFEVLPCHGTYFQLLSYKQVADMPEKEMAEHLTKEFGVASIPTSAFYENENDNGVLRFCFAKSEETLEKATGILCKI